MTLREANYKVGQGRLRREGYGTLTPPPCILTTTLTSTATLTQADRLRQEGYGAGELCDGGYTAKEMKVAVAVALTLTGYTPRR